jgi:hypothetical protein
VKFRALDSDHPENDYLVEVVSNNFVPMKKEFEKISSNEKVTKEFFAIVTDKDISMIVNYRE